MKAEDVPEQLANTPCADHELTAPVTGPALDQRRIAIVSTAGLMHRNDKPFTLGAVDYRILDIESDQDIMMSHISTNFDRSGFAQDHNIALPTDRLHEKAEQGEIGSVARYHYSFMGATEPEKMQPAAEQLAKNLRGDEVDGLILIPV
jgi:D-proline reductase (dithiol) PrdB